MIRKTGLGFNTENPNVGGADCQTMDGPGKGWKFRENGRWADAQGVDRQPNAIKGRKTSQK